MAVETNRFYDFGPFRLDAEQKLLFRDSKPVPLTPKALETLTALVENGGRLVTKEDLMKRVWPDAFVEDGNLTFNISQLRNALGDDRNNGNRFIETIPRRGYRFVAALNGNGHGQVAAMTVEVHAASTPAVQITAQSLWFRWWQIPVALALVGAGFGAYELFRPMVAPHLVSDIALTSDRRVKRETILTDGLQVYFTELGGQNVEQFSIPAQGGVTMRVLSPLLEASVIGVSPDQSIKLLWKNDGSLWRAGPPHGLPERVGDIVAANSPRWSPDGRSIAYSKGTDLYIANLEGAHPHKLTTAPGSVGWIRWSPDGRLLRFTVRTALADFIPSAIWEVAIDGSGLRPVLPGWHGPSTECCGDWTPDGRYYVFQSPASPGSYSDLWAIREKTGLFSRAGRPFRLTSGPIRFAFPTPSPDGRHLFAIGTEEKGELVVWDDARHEFVPFLGGMSATWVTFSPDRKWITYVDYPTNTLWRMDVDGRQPRQLTFEPLIVIGPAISPDGKMIAFRGRRAGAPGSKIYLIPSSGGEYQLLIPGRQSDEGIPTWSPEGQQIVFGDVPEAFGKDDGTHAIRIYNLATHNLTDLPGSRGLWSPRWSSDGRYISAVTIDNTVSRKQELMLFDRTTQTWNDLHQDQVRDPMWSRDSKYLYCKGESDRDKDGIFRVRIGDGALERVATYDNVERADEWAGLSPEGSPMLLRRLSGQEIYALEVNWP